MFPRAGKTALGLLVVTCLTIAAQPNVVFEFLRYAVDEKTLEAIKEFVIETSFPENR